MKVAPAFFRVTSVLFRGMVTVGMGWRSPALPEPLGLDASGWEPSGLDASGWELSGLEASGWEPSGLEASEEEPPGWLELEPLAELPPGLEVEELPGLPPQAARDRTIAAARAIVRMRRFIVK